MPTRFLVLLFATVFAACGGKSAADYQREAQAALDGKDLAKAVAIADEALSQEAIRRDAAATWRLEQVRLDALARSGKGAQVKSELERLAGTNPQQITAALYRALAEATRP